MADSGSSTISMLRSGAPTIGQLGMSGRLRVTVTERERRTKKAAVKALFLCLQLLSQASCIRFARPRGERVMELLGAVHPLASGSVFSCTLGAYLFRQRLRKRWIQVGSATATKLETRVQLRNAVERRVSEARAWPDCPQ